MIPRRNAIPNLRKRFLDLEGDGRMAVALTIVATISGCLFGGFAPGLQWEQRLTRVGIDGFFLIGVLGFLWSGERPTIRRGWIATTRRLAMVAGAVVAIVVTMAIPNVDPWLRAYRLCLGFILLGMGIWGTGRILPRGYFKRSLPLLAIVGVVEAATVVYVSMSVDLPITEAGSRSAFAALMKQLEGPGLEARGGTSLILDQMGQLVERRGGRYYAKDGLLDAVHFVNGDMVGATNLLVESQFRNEAGRATIGFVGKSSMCRAIAKIQPPTSGYRRAFDQNVAIEMAMDCAQATGDEEWKKRLLEGAREAEATDRAQARMGMMGSWSCLRLRLAWYDWKEIRRFLESYGTKADRRGTDEDWARNCVDDLSRRPVREVSSR